ncbi:dTDP-4-dehydrorhamnose 3,5-epimerase [Salipaludibacillus sp. CUR1]|uniref:dTDP-4-dehydrorhamnose 3,5-epimerase n=1 Tax=Salipaludibacillus sp. CUR1 TaxID=2820003 RepID=UPI001E29E51D|nr:dTDP-4-dehydrorhamnose 3,5-epimerase [Salipaludibacillus sp. CUR1]MCE7792763.1 dTDP-4-dehydrorhamnose 3,5-epimerase [Salipaludibacillus sp. CUR1]
MKIETTFFKEVKVITPKVFTDHRGFFMESYNAERFKEAGIAFNFIQDNHSLSVNKGTIRGLHFQLPPKSQAKLVRVVKGAIYDVAVDIRKSSPHFGKWVGVELSAENKKQLIIPRGFAHGFCTLEENTEVIYKVDEYYAPEYDRGIRWDDPALNINWPANEPVLSEKDLDHPNLEHADVFK